MMEEKKKKVKRKKKNTPQALSILGIQVLTNTDRDVDVKIPELHSLLAVSRTQHLSSSPTAMETECALWVSCSDREHQDRHTDSIVLRQGQSAANSLVEKRTVCSCSATKPCGLPHILHLVKEQRHVHRLIHFQCTLALCIDM